MTMTEDGDGFNTLPTSLDDLKALRGIRYEMPAALDSFYRRYARAQLDYATTILCDKEAARAVVRGLYHHLAMNWAAIQLEGCGPELHAWRILKMLVAEHARQVLADTPNRAAVVARDRSLAVREVVHTVLQAYRVHMADSESPVGLYTALAALPDRQFDVMILHYELGYPTGQVADIMGLKAGTVRTHRRLAEESVAARLGINLDADEESLRCEIVRDVTTTLMFGTGRPERETRRVAKLARADAYLRSLCCQLVGRPEAPGRLARVAEEPDDVDGAVVFGCLLHLAGELEGALWWWRFASGAEDATAGYCLYLHHLHHGELRDAEHWMSQALSTGNEIDFTPPPSPQRPSMDLHTTFLRQAVERLQVDEEDGTRYHHPDRRLAAQIEDLDGVCC